MITKATALFRDFEKVRMICYNWKGKYFLEFASLMILINCLPLQLFV